MTALEQLYAELHRAVAVLNVSCQRFAEAAQAQHEQRINQLAPGFPNINLILDDWQSSAWATYAPAADYPLPSGVRIGTWPVQLSGNKKLPAVLPIFEQRHVFIQGDETQARQQLQLMALRMALTAAPGSLCLILTDPLGGGSNVTSLLRLPASVRSPQVASSPDEIEKAIQELVTHIKAVIQQRLLDTYADAHAYNAAQPAIAIPYYGLLLPDFPAGLSERAWDNLKFIAQGGPRAGVMLFASLNPNQVAPRDAKTGARAHMDDIIVKAYVLQLSNNWLCWQHDSLGPMEAICDTLPTPDQLIRMCEALKQAEAQSSSHVPFAGIALKPAQWWQGNATDGLRVTIGIDSKGQRCDLALGSPNVNMLIGGAPGYGKSRLLDVLITQLATIYSPDEVTLYLLDLKEGVGFQDYVRLPHARVVALENEREFGLGILRRLQAEIPIRSALFKAANQSIDNYPHFRRVSKQPLPRILLIVDEFQVLFSEEDGISREAMKILEDLSRRGRSYGIHLVLCSQSPRAYAANIDPILSQVGLRFAFRCDERVSHSILGDGNGEARNLKQPGEGILNSGMGSRDANLHLRVALLDPTERARLLGQIQAKAGNKYTPPVIFEGNTPAKLGDNAELRAAWQQFPKINTGRKAKLWLGEPLEINDAGSHAQFDLIRYGGNNTLIIGDSEHHAYALLLACVMSLNAQIASKDLHLLVADFAVPESEMQDVWKTCLPTLAPSSNLMAGRQLAALLPDLRKTIEARLDGAAASKTIVLTICGLHRWREMRPSGEYGGQSESSKQLLWILENGPEVGVHVLAWADNLPNFERALKRSALMSFDLRVGLRMSDADSGALFGNAIAAKLADLRALLRHETWQIGEFKKFKPYALDGFLKLAQT